MLYIDLLCGTIFLLSVPLSLVALDIRRRQEAGDGEGSSEEMYCVSSLEESDLCKVYDVGLRDGFDCYASVPLGFVESNPGA